MEEDLSGVDQWLPVALNIRGIMQTSSSEGTDRSSSSGLRYFRHATNVAWKTRSPQTVDICHSETLTTTRTETNNFTAA